MSIFVLLTCLLYLRKQNSTLLPECIFKISYHRRIVWLCFPGFCFFLDPPITGRSLSGAFYVSWVFTSYKELSNSEVPVLLKTFSISCPDNFFLRFIKQRVASQSVLFNGAIPQSGGLNRPIFILTCFSKILENLIRRRLTDFFNKHLGLNSNQ